MTVIPQAALAAGVAAGAVLTGSLMAPSVGVFENYSDVSASKLAGGKAEVLAKLFGGQGTINVPSWSPDCLKLAFVSYSFVD